MESRGSLRAPVLLRPRLEVLESGLSRLEDGDEEGLIVPAVEENPDDVALLENAFASPGRTLRIVPTAGDPGGGEHRPPHELCIHRLRSLAFYDEEGV